MLYFIYSSLLAMLYDSVKFPHYSRTHYKELLTKCIWKIVNDFPKWGDDLSYDLVLAQIHRFLEVINIIYYIFKNILHQHICDMLYYFMNC